MRYGERLFVFFIYFHFGGVGMTVRYWAISSWCLFIFALAYKVGSMRQRGKSLLTMCHLCAHWLKRFDESVVYSLTGRKHNWRVKICCKTKDNRELWAVIVTVSTKYRFEIEDYRTIKCAVFGKGLKLTYPGLPLPGPGGQLVAEPVMYLGKFRSREYSFGGK